MLIGVPKERKIQEYRVALTPEAVSVLTGRGHTVREVRGNVIYTYTFGVTVHISNVVEVR